MTGDVYNALADKSRYTFSTDVFSEYKDVNSDGTFGKMVSEAALVSKDAVITLTTGASSAWGHYTMKISGVSLDIGLSGDKVARKYLGVLLETKSGDIFGMRHNNNIYSDADTIAFCVSNDYVEPHGNGVERSYKYTRSLEGQTITKITYMLKDIPDVVISCDVYIPPISKASAAVSADKITAGKNLAIPLKFADLPDGVTYSVTSIYSGKGRTRTNFTDYTYANNVLTINGDVPAGDYTVILEAEGYTDISAEFTVAANYYYAETDMTWAEFYAGEVGTSSSDLWDAGLDAVSSPTARIAGRFTQLASVSNDKGGRDITGVKAVHVAMTENVYQLLSKDERYAWSSEAFSEYKLVSADGSFGEMLTEYEYADDAVVTLLSGAGATWGNYMLNVSSVDVTLGSGDTGYFLGALITTSSGDVYGLRHNSNLWFSANDIALSYKEFVEPHGISRDYDYTSDLAGKTITKIQYMLKDIPDVVVSCSVYLKLQSTATVSCEYPEGTHGIMAGTGAPITIKFEGLSSDVSYDIVSVTPSIRHASALSPKMYTYSGDVLILDASLSAGKYKALFGTEKYSDLAVTVEIFTTDVTSSIVSPDNNGAKLSFLLSPRGYADSIDEVLDANKFVNATDYTSIAGNKTEDYSAGISGSGFSFDIVLDGISSDYTGIVGFSKVMNMTSSTLGSALYEKVYSVFNALPKFYEEWRAPSSADFAKAGLRIVLLQADGISRDVTGLVGGGVIISSDGSIMLNYGAMAADCAQSEIEEGSYLLSDEGETLIADGVRDSHIKVTIYIEEVSSSGSGGNSGQNSGGSDNSGNNSGNTDNNSGGDSTGDNSGDNSGGDNSGDNSGGDNSGDNSGGDNSGDNSGGDNSGDNSGGDNSGDNNGGNSGNNGGNSGGDNSGNSGPVFVTPSRPSFSMTNTTILGRITSFFQALFSFITGDTEVAELPEDAMSGGEREASPEELAAVPAGQSPVLVLPIIVVPRPAIYVFGVSLAETGLSVGDPIFVLMNVNAVSGAQVSASAEEDGACVFVDDDGNQLDTVPASMNVNVAAYMEPGNEYAPMITTADDSAGGNDTPNNGGNTPNDNTADNDVGSSGGGCDAGFGVLALAVLAGLTLRRK
ncbi:MAG: SYNERG-CTERM sorting domain-containing protein [Synergistaceae bacterium]|nr:SYNERG-CTERM sorting domain-containing protein [Synergistaceae bacterium]